MLKGFALVRHFEEVVRHLAEKGHTVILTEAKRKVSRTNIPDAVARLPGCSAIRASVGGRHPSDFCGLWTSAASDVLDVWICKPPADVVCCSHAVGGLPSEVTLPAPRWHNLVRPRIGDELAQMLVHVAGDEKS